MAAFGGIAIALILGQLIWFLSIVGLDASYKSMMLINACVLDLCYVTCLLLSIVAIISLDTLHILGLPEPNLRRRLEQMLIHLFLLTDRMNDSKYSC